MAYLLDTNVCIRLLRNREQVVRRLVAANPTNCYISDITVAELYFGAEKNQFAEREMSRTQAFIDNAKTLSIQPGLRIYAEQKARLERLGQPLDDFDLLIASTALANELILVTHNTKHFARILGLQLEDWELVIL